MAGKLACTPDPVQYARPTPRRLRDQESSNFDVSFQVGTSSTPANLMKDFLLPHFQRLCREQETTVRTHVAAVFHEFAKSLRHDPPLVIDSFIDLCNTGDVEVINLLAIRLEDTLEAIYGHGHSDTSPNGNGNVEKPSAFCPQFHPAHNRLLRALLSCNRIVRKSSQWRTHEQLLLSFSCLNRFLLSEELCQIFVPVLKEEILTARAIPCRMAALRTMLKWTGEFKSTEDVKMVADFCKQNLALNHSCHKRVLFLDACVMSIELISKHFFKQHFFKFAMQLVHDSVLNVRMKLCNLLPVFKSAMILPIDDNYLDDLESALKVFMQSNPTGHMAEVVDKTVAELSPPDAINNSHAPLQRKKSSTPSITSKEATQPTKLAIKNSSAPLPMRTFPAVLRAMSAIKDGLTPGQYKNKSIDDHPKAVGTSTKLTPTDDVINGDLVNSSPSPYVTSKWGDKTVNGHVTLANGLNGKSSNRFVDFLTSRPATNKKVAIIYPRPLLTRTPSPRPKSHPTTLECGKCGDVNGNIPISDAIYSTPSVASINGITSVKSSAIDSKLRRLLSRPGQSSTSPIDIQNGTKERIVPIKLITTRSPIDYDWPTSRPPTPVAFRRLSASTASLPRASSVGGGSRVRNIPVVRTGMVMKSVEKLEAGV